jgi:hypothetical protein
MRPVAMSDANVADSEPSKSKIIKSRCMTEQ